MLQTKRMNQQSYQGRNSLHIKENLVGGQAPPIKLKTVKLTKMTVVLVLGATIGNFWIKWTDPFSMLNNVLLHM